MQSPALAGLALAGLVQAPLSGQYTAATPSQAGSSPVKLSGYIQAREVYQSNIGLTSSINRARLAASGAVVEAVTWRIQGEFRTGSIGTGRASVSLQDAYLRYAPGGWAIQLGQFKTPFTREYMASLADIETADRATAVDSLAPKRDIGLMGEYSYRRFSLWAGVFNGEGQNVTANADSTVLGVARLAVRLLPQLSLAVNGARYFGDSTRYGVVPLTRTPGWPSRASTWVRRGTKPPARTTGAGTASAQSSSPPRSRRWRSTRSLAGPASPRP